MKYLADTSFLIDLINNKSRAVKLASILDNTGEVVGLSVISVEEYLRGIFYLYRGREKTLKEKLSKAKRDLSAFEILPLTFEIAEKAAEIEAYLMKNGIIIGYADILIAATAKANDLILITNNVRHFKRIPKLKIQSY